MAEPIRTIGVVLSERVLAGLLVDGRLQGGVQVFPLDGDNDQGLIELHTEALITTICQQVRQLADGQGRITAVGVAMPGLIRDGVVEDSPNLLQLKGVRIRELLVRALREHGVDAPVCILNDADGVAAGYAAQQGKLEQLIRVWTLGVGIGYGRHPYLPGVGEGGHTIVTLDEKENYCGCGGRGHLEGIMGHRAMRLRFLDLEPEEVFAAAKTQGTPDSERCRDFVRLWHRALAAGIANSIHLDGPGKFFLTGFNARFVDLPLLKQYLGEMVKMSPLQSYTLEIMDEDPVARVTGAAVAAERLTCGA